MPKVSVILTSFNHEQYLASAIDSVLSQSFSGFELIIWDDASTDDSWAIIDSYKDPRIKSFRNESRRRGVYGINKAIKEVAQGKYIAIHHSDDVFDAEKLSRQAQVLDERPELGAVFTHVRLIGEEGKPFIDTTHHYHAVFDQPNRTRYEWLKFFFHSGNALCHPSVMIRRRCFENVGYYDRRLAQIGDLDFWIRLCMRYEVHIIESALTSFRIRENEANQSGNTATTRVRIAMEYQQVLKTYLSIPSVETLVRIFPDIDSPIHKEGNVIPFLIAHYAARQPDMVHQAFGINTLYELMGDPVLAEQIETMHGFSYADLIRLVAEKDVFSMRYEVPAFQAIVNLEAELQRVKSSVSWKVTRPLRLIANLPRIVSGAVKSK